MRRYASLRRRADFARLRRHGRRLAGRTLTLYLADAFPRDASSLVGITVNKAIGKAVVRNKLRRRLAAIVNDALASPAAPFAWSSSRAPAAAAPTSPRCATNFSSALHRA